MDELVKLVSERVGIGEEQAQGAIDTVVGFLQERLPGPIAEQVSGILEGGGEGGEGGGLGGMLGGRFGQG